MSDHEGERKLSSDSPIDTFFRQQTSGWSNCQQSAPAPIDLGDITVNVSAMQDNNGLPHHYIMNDDYDDGWEQRVLGVQQPPESNSSILLGQQPDFLATQPSTTVIDSTTVTASTDYYATTDFYSNQAEFMIPNSNVNQAPVQQPAPQPEQQPAPPKKPPRKRTRKKATKQCGCNQQPMVECTQCRRFCHQEHAKTFTNGYLCAGCIQQQRS
ncbi:hypothetical protein ACOME3_007200 [Neoechinorhynchus agilis]